METAIFLSVRNGSRIITRKWNGKKNPWDSPWGVRPMLGGWACDAGHRIFSTLTYVYRFFQFPERLCPKNFGKVGRTVGESSHAETMARASGSRTTSVIVNSH